jgi:hypothetical protein
MTRREQLLQAAEDGEKRAARNLERFGLGRNDDTDRVTDWLLSHGAVPATVAVIVLVLYLVVSLIFGS